MTATLRVAICNLQSGIGTTRGYWHYLATGWRYLLPHGSGPVDQAAVFLRSEAIDVAALCEIEGGSRRTRGVDQVARLAAATPLRAATFFPSFVVGARVNQGNAIMARFPLRHVRNHALPGFGEPRFVGEAEVNVGGTGVRVFVTHLSLERKLRTPQIHRLARLVGRGRAPTILAGDFNVSDRAELRLLAESHLQQAAWAATFPSWRPTKALDHLFFSHHFTLVDCGPFDRFRFSDHLPLVATVRLVSGVERDGPAPHGR